MIENSFCELNLDQNDEKVGQKYFSADFQEFLGLGNTLTSEKFSETSPVMHLNRFIFQSQ